MDGPRHGSMARHGVSTVQIQCRFADYAKSFKTMKDMQSMSALAVVLGALNHPE
jgi:hypothetical protein